MYTGRDCAVTAVPSRPRVVSQLGPDGEVTERVALDDMLEIDTVCAGRCSLGRAVVERRRGEQVGELACEERVDGRSERRRGRRRIRRPLRRPTGALLVVSCARGGHERRQGQARRERASRPRRGRQDGADGDGKVEQLPRGLRQRPVVVVPRVPPSRFQELADEVLRVLRHGERERDDMRISSNLSQQQGFVSLHNEEEIRVWLCRALEEAFLLELVDVAVAKKRGANGESTFHPKTRSRLRLRGHTHV